MKNKKKMSPTLRTLNPNQPFDVNGKFVSSKLWVTAIESVATFLQRRYMRRKGGVQANALGFMLTQARVEFSSEIKSVELQSDYAESTLKIVAPSLRTRSRVLIEKRRNELLSEFSDILKRSQYAATVQFWNSLSQVARKSLQKEFKNEMSKRSKNRSKIRAKKLSRRALHGR